MSDTRIIWGDRMLKRAGILCALVSVCACNNSDFSNSPPASARQKKSTAAEATGAKASDSTGDRVAASGEGAVGSEDSTKSASAELGVGQSKTTFSYGPKSAKADFLFVFDNSSSMQDDLEKMKLGFEGLGGAKWPADTVIAVMTTMPGNPVNLNDVHPAVDRYASIEKEPGFLSLMSETARTNFRTANSSMGGRLSEPMCLQEWFKPSDKNNAGKSCLSAAIQSPFTGVGVEAGLVAVSQILERRNQLFRMNSNVHVVFVSDTQDPGQDPNDSGKVKALSELRPTFAMLKEKIMSNSSVAGVKLHGVTPSPTCSAAESVAKRLGTPYQDAINASGGTWLDFCDGNSARSNYVPVAEQIVANTLPEPVFVLSEIVASIVKVEVSGQPLDSSRVTLLADKKSVRIDGLNPASDVEVAITYMK